MIHVGLGYVNSVGQLGLAFVWVDVSVNNLPL